MKEAAGPRTRLPSTPPRHATALTCQAELILKDTWTNVNDLLEPS